MPLRANVGCSRKVGLPDYGSRGASVNLELELDAALATEPDRLQEKLRNLFRLAREAVDDELQADARSSNGQQPRSSNGRNQRDDRPATASQCRALRAIAERPRLDLAGVLHDRFRTDQPENLSLPEASRLIDELKGEESRNGSRR